MEHYAYSQNLSPYDYHIFSPLKEKLRRHRCGEIHVQLTENLPLFPFFNNIMNNYLPTRKMCCKIRRLNRKMRHNYICYKTFQYSFKINSSLYLIHPEILIAVGLINHLIVIMTSLHVKDFF